MLAEVLSKFLNNARLPRAVPNEHYVGSTRQHSGDVLVILITALVAAMSVMLLSLANMMMLSTFVGAMQMHDLSIMIFRYMPDVAIITRDRGNYPFP